MNPALLRLRRRVWRRLATSVRELTGPALPELARYERRYRRALAGEVRPLRFEEVVARAADARLVFCGDYHTFRPAQATCLALLEAMASRSPYVVLLLELALEQHQAHLDRWVAGRLDESELLRRLDYGRTWGFSWAGYRPLFEYARANAVPIVGINGPGRALEVPLAERDRFAAEVIARTAAARPGARLLVLAGDLHLAPRHLPREVLRLLPGEPPSTLSVYQNADLLYWRLAARGVEADAVEVAPGQVAVFTGTPWARLESYLSWLEQADEPGAAALGLSGEGLPDYTGRILELVELKARFLGLPSGGADRFVVYTGDDLSFATEMERSRGTRRLLPFVLASDVFLVPQTEVLYLARLDLGHAAEAAAEVLLELASGGGEGAEPAANAFLRRAHRRALAYFGSKLLNPQRRPAAPRGAGPAAETLVRGYVRPLRAALLAGKGSGLLASARADDLRLRFALSTALGRALGEELYAAYVAGAVPLDEVRRRFRERPRREEDAREALVELARAAPEPALAG